MQAGGAGGKWMANRGGAGGRPVKLDAQLAEFNLQWYIHVLPHMISFIQPQPLLPKRCCAHTMAIPISASNLQLRNLVGPSDS